MSNLMDTYDNMMKSAQEEESEATMNKEAEELVHDRIDVISKYAEAANTLLTD